MAEVTFNYEGNKEKIKCNINDKMKEVIYKFLINTNKQKNYDKLSFLYNGSNVNGELTFNEQANELDKSKKKMKIIVNKIVENKIEIKQSLSKDIICPRCYENALLEIKDFKINLYCFKNNHSSNDILFDEFEETQKIPYSETLCKKCYNNNKINTYNNEFYFCITCSKNICPSCLTKHDKKHKIVNHEDKNYICTKHNEFFNNYCKTCNIDICIKCEQEHNHHDILDLSKIIFTKNERLKMKTKLKSTINKFKNKITIIKEILNLMVNIMDQYYKINEKIINNYHINKRNYSKLQNLYNLYNNNEKLIKELNDLINNDKLSEIFDFSFNNFYNENGEKYIGEMINGYKNGKGVIYYDINCQERIKGYEGEFKNDQPEGKGAMYWKNGDKYEGDWKKGMSDGKGIYYHNNGDRYEGDYKKDKLSGKGRYYWNDGYIFEGHWVENNREGKGVYYFNNGNVFKGEYKNDKEEGKGIYYYNEGGKYEGEIKDGEKEGKGIMLWKDGTRYEGEWKNSLRDGRGILYNKTGEIKRGYWKEGIFIGNHN